MAPFGVVFGEIAVKPDEEIRRLRHQADNRDWLIAIVLWCLSAWGLYKFSFWALRSIRSDTITDILELVFYLIAFVWVFLLYFIKNLVTRVFEKEPPEKL